MSDVTQYHRACHTPARLQPAPHPRTGTRHPPSPPLRAPFARF
ncbi:hypothetical protein [Pseudomonas aeruginosa]|nr:hypothetical protein [Pseudomonas aeruginosa]